MMTKDELEIEDVDELDVDELAACIRIEVRLPPGVPSEIAVADASTPDAFYRAMQKIRDGQTPEKP